MKIKWHSGADEWASCSQCKTLDQLHGNHRILSWSGTYLKARPSKTGVRLSLKVWQRDRAESNSPVWTSKATISTADALPAERETGSEKQTGGWARQQRGPVKSTVRHTGFILKGKFRPPATFLDFQIFLPWASQTKLPYRLSSVESRNWGGQMKPKLSASKG